ncbi:MAG: hypothetical protein DLM61_21300 [Pseudonocardiales bacterium]|nr:MAG: hypothetical protein DLM61_21300 [Pseudonocardiales bacterium]
MTAGERLAPVSSAAVTVEGVRSPYLQAGPTDTAEAVVFVHGNRVRQPTGGADRPHRRVRPGGRARPDRLRATPTNLIASATPSTVTPAISAAGSSTSSTSTVPTWCCTTSAARGV